MESCWWSWIQRQGCGRTRTRNRRNSRTTRRSRPPSFTSRTAGIISSSTGASAAEGPIAPTRFAWDGANRSTEPTRIGMERRWSRAAERKCWRAGEDTSVPAMLPFTRKVASSGWRTTTTTARIGERRSCVSSR